MLNNSFSFGVCLAALVISIVNLLYTLMLRRTEKPQNKIFICILIILIINSINGIISAVGRAMPDSDKMKIILDCSRYLYFVTHTALCPLFLYYIYCLIGEPLAMPGHNLKLKIYTVLFVIYELLVITNPLTHWVYSYNEEHVIQRHLGEYLIYLMAAVYYVIASFRLFFSWEVLSKRRRSTMTLFLIVAAAGILLQLLHKNLKVEVFMEAIGSVGILIALENDDDRKDFSSGFYNRATLNVDVAGWLRSKKRIPTSLVIIRIANFDLVSKMAASENFGIISDITGSYFKSLMNPGGLYTWSVYPANIYSPRPDTFVLSLRYELTQQAEQLAQSICSRFDSPWKYKGSQIQISAVVMLVNVLDRISSASELFYLINCPLPKNISKRFFRGKDLDYIIRRQAVESAVSRGLEENSFEVYYQPTYNIDGTLHGAEALLRMHDRELDLVMPDEFIPVAEQIGLIDAVDDFVLDSVCKFIKTGVPQKSGMDSINVNLSVVQCMRPGFVERVNSIVEGYGVDRRFINFEITESIAANDYGFLSNIIARLKRDGFMFSMDDYGTGYSNVSAVFSLDLDVIKIDKSLLWNAEKDELGMIILENTIRMIRQMKKKILVEGVETQTQIDLLDSLGVDYLQGFYFSKPVPKTDFVELIGGKC